MPAPISCARSKILSAVEDPLSWSFQVSSRQWPLSCTVTYDCRVLSHMTYRRNAEFVTWRPCGVTFLYLAPESWRRRRHGGDGTEAQRCGGGAAVAVSPAQRFNRRLWLTAAPPEPSSRRSEQAFKAGDTAPGSGSMPLSISVRSVA